ncbi:MAG: TAXI family TRAP transporter solute-binding subunit, partial [Burkholderiales bacterium]
SLHGTAVPAAAQFKMVTATEGADFQIGRDLARFVAPAADVQLDVLASGSSAEALRRLRSEPGVKLATVQSDAYQAILEQAARGNAAAGDLVRPLRVVVPLYNEELHLVARADAPFNALHEIKDARINVGPRRGDTAATLASLYPALFGKPLTDARASYLPHAEALVKLVTDRTIDVVAIVAGQPATLLANMKPEARQYIKLLKLDRATAAGRAAARRHLPATVRAESYPALLAQDVPTLAVRVYLVTQDFRDHYTEHRLILLGRSLCRDLSALRANGHAKWQEVEPKLAQLPPGMSYYQPTTTELHDCPVRRPAKPKP